MVSIENDEIGKYIHILSRQVRRKVDEAVADYNVTAVQCSLIGFLFESNKKGNVYAKDIESKFNMRRATVAEILSLMEKNGLIVRESNNGDARLKKITLTQKAIEIQKSIEKEVNKVENDLKKGLTNEEINNFMRTLKQMSENID